ncbi:LuxR C-terminal-related transcriptional regulator [Streptomyces sp. NPDC052020]|uniref:LuxR C-terminal-related transcriptional regulator n=1 Tax=Streptomyces sp. NPDC052020 TaxID=3155677 RepID=UPI0034312350
MGDKLVSPSTLQQVYSYALNRERGLGINAAELATGLCRTREEAEAAVERLLSLGLLRDLPDRGFAAVPPDEAAADILGPLERDMRTRRSRIDELRRELMSFMPAFEASLSAHEHRSQFQLLDNLADVRAVITDLTDQCEEEILTAQPGGGREESVLEEAAPRDEKALSRGVRMQILYQHTARFSQGTSAYVDRVTRLGAQVRTLDDHFTRLLVFDRKVALIAVPDNPHAAALIREPHVVAFVTGTYERLWLYAEPFAISTDSRAEIADELKQSIIRLLMAGLTDASIASRLGMSVRTCRRHVAELMTELGAQSRFQAGYLLAARERMHT